MKKRFLKDEKFVLVFKNETFNKEYYILCKINELGEVSLLCNMHAGPFHEIAVNNTAFIKKNPKFRNCNVLRNFSDAFIFKSAFIGFSRDPKEISKLFKGFYFLKGVKVTPDLVEYLERKIGYTKIKDFKYADLHKLMHNLPKTQVDTVPNTLEDFKNMGYIVKSLTEFMVEEYYKDKLLDQL